jgi:hypothetical protein
VKRRGPSTTARPTRRRSPSACGTWGTSSERAFGPSPGARLGGLLPGRETYAESRASRIGNRLIRGLYLDLGGDHQDSVFLAGSGRSGTTWVSEIVNHARGYRYVFEPFHPGRVGAVSHFGAKQYLRPDDRRPEFLEAARSIVCGRVRGGWTDKFHRKFVARRRLIKDIRANLLLAWLRANFPGMPIILLLRHPCAVAESKMKLGWRPDLEAFLSQGELMEDFLGPFEPAMRGARTDFERHVLVWCAENYVPLKQFAPGEVHVCFYEDFCESPGEEVGRLFAFLGEKFDRTVLEKMKRPSSLSRTGSAVLSGGRSSDGWVGAVPEGRRERAVELLSLFGLDAIYGRDPMPDPAGVRAFTGTG